MRAFDVPSKKSHWPYEYFHDISQLNETQLPPKDAFYSNLKRKNTLENDTRVEYERLIAVDGKSHTDAINVLHLDDIPPSTIDKTYNELQDIWRKNGMTTLRDFLRYYSELDVGPMVKAIERF